ncbi:RNA recognition motif domain containing protein [Entamoeba nuttalli P19]|uniref:RNA recognition motif domain containing protein n=2 Tax=Entamoeba nuttalli TaxID=412467 RepID=K2HRS6_ENTNP|nr:RNA recognition motif domain containing protein [Entamoeba nuttalli P19]EKE38710.1 RNA recognition motif domain containing protein [Entamoeba nuttalli P19]|eukprot:XP_008858963.1 RNA recognition motif domain containing protein [Entamoeba nuttalli P19]
MLLLKFMLKNKNEEKKKLKNKKRKGFIMCADLYQTNTNPLKLNTTLNDDKKKQSVTLRNVDGKRWVDESMADWPTNDFRMFIGNLGKEVDDTMLKIFFSKYPSVQKVKVIINPHTNKSKGYGFVSFSDPNEYLLALRTLNGKYIGTRPCKLSKGKWEKRAEKSSTKEGKRPKLPK